MIKLGLSIDEDDDKMEEDMPDLVEKKEEGTTSNVMEEVDWKNFFKCDNKFFI